MSSPAPNGPKWRNSPFAKPSAGPSPILQSNGSRHKSSLSSSQLSPAGSNGHGWQQSLSPLNSPHLSTLGDSTLKRTSSHRHTGSASATFAPQFIKSDEIQTPPERVRGIEGENDFSGKRYLWLKDAEAAFIKGWVVEELEGGRLLVQCDDGSVCYSRRYC